MNIIFRCIVFSAAVLAMSIAGISGVSAADRGDKTQADALGNSASGNGKGTQSAMSRDEQKKIIVARVNGAGITLLTLNDNVQRTTLQKSHGGVTDEEKARIRKESLDKLIFEEMAFQKAKSEGLAAGPEEIEKRLADLRKKLGGEEGLTKTLATSGMTEEELRSGISRGILLQKIFEREIFDKTPPVSENELKKEYERQKQMFEVPEKIVVIDMVLFLDPEDKESGVKAGQILSKVLEDRDRDPANIAPDGTFIVNDLDVKKTKQPEIYAEALKLKVGELSGVIRTGDSMHIIKLKEHVPEKSLSLEDMRKFLESNLTSDARRKRLHEWETELKKDAVIEIIDIKNGG